MLWLLLLPFRLAFGILFGIFMLPIVIILLPFALLLWLPFTLLRASLKLAFGLVVLPMVFVVLLLATLAAGVGLALALAVPLVPIAVVVFFIWLLTRSSPAATVIRG